MTENRYRSKSEFIKALQRWADKWKNPSEAATMAPIDRILKAGNLVTIF